MTPQRSAARRLALALGASAVLLLSSTSAAQEPAEQPVCERGWQELLLRDDIAPEAVAAGGPDELWIAGGSMLGGGRRQAAVLHLDGGSDELELPPAPDTRDSGFMGLTAFDDEGRLWAVGYGREVDFVAAYAARRNGSNWDVSEIIRPDGSNSALTDVASSPELGTWAAGFLQGPPGDQRPWVLERRSGDWRATELPLAEGERATLAGISASAAGGLWVAGTAMSDAAMVPYLAVRAGDRWERHQSGDLEQAALADITVPGADHGWAVGHRLDGPTIRGLLLRWDGDGWSQAPGPTLGDEPLLLTAVSWVDDVLTVGGTTWDRQKQRYLPFAASRTGEDGEWFFSLGRPGWGMGTITDLAGDPATDGWAVGRVDDGLVARLCGTPADAPADTPPSTGDEVTVRPDVEPAGEFGPASALEGEVVAVDVAKEAGLPTASQSWGAVAADFDADGRDDVFLGRHGARARLYLNIGAGFVESEQRFGGGDRHACAAADVDGSGLLDLYCAFGASRGTGTKHNQLWLDPAGPEPRLHPDAGGATEPLGRGRQPRYFDIDEDGDLDLFLGQETKRMDGQPSTNRGFLATGPARFEAAALPGIDTGLATEDLDVADYDGDGRDDLLLVYLDQRAREPRAGIRLYRNLDGLAFADVTARVGIETIGEQDAAFADLDGDGAPDLIQLSPSRVRFSHNRDGRFEQAAEYEVSAGAALAAGDADGDGDVDLYVLQGKSKDGGSDLILLNDGDGRSFRRLAVPNVASGSEDDVIALDYDQDGRTDFLALNGRNSERGPVQLITLRPAQ